MPTWIHRTVLLIELLCYCTSTALADRYYYYYNSGLQQQYVLYTQSDLGAEASVLLDPNTLSEDGTVALKDIEFSEDGKYMSYSISSGGSDWSYIQVGAGPQHGCPWCGIAPVCGNNTSYASHAHMVLELMLQRDEESIICST